MPDGRLQKRERSQALRESDRTAGQLHAIETVLAAYELAEGMRVGDALWRAIKERAGVSTGTLKNFFYGNHWPQRDTLERLARGLGQPDEWIQHDLVDPVDHPEVHPWAVSELYRRRVAGAVSDAMFTTGTGYKDKDKLGGVDQWNVAAIVRADPLVSFDLVRAVAEALGVNLAAISPAPPVASPTAGR